MTGVLSRKVQKKTVNFLYNEVNNGQKVRLMAKPTNLFLITLPLFFLELLR